MFLSIGMLKQKYFLTDIFILSAEKQPIKLSWRKIECLHVATYQNLAADRLVEAYADNKLKSPLKEIAEKLNEESNPVVMLIKYKK